MSLKKYWLKKKQANVTPAIYNTLVIPGEPFIYSGNYRIGNRTRLTGQEINKKQWQPLLKCFFRQHLTLSKPLVFVVRFFVSPTKRDNITLKELKQESRMAVHGFELCDYMLHFMEMFRMVLFTSYKQIVKIDMEKIYSDVPRTEVQFMTWGEYVELYNDDTLQSQAETFCPSREIREQLQSKCNGDERIEELSIGEPGATEDTDADVSGSADVDSTLSTSSRKISNWTKTRSAKLPTKQDKARYRQSIKVSG